MADKLTEQAAEPFEIRAEKWVYGGDALSRREGRVVLTPFLLPGEVATVVTEPYKSGLLTGTVREIVERSAVRVEADCPHFGRCGGCQYQHAPYSFQVEQKVEILREVFRRVGKIEAPAVIDAVTGPPWEYRNRTQLHLEGGVLGYREARSHRLCPVERCPISSPALNHAISVLREMQRDPRFPSFVHTIEIFSNETETQVNVIETDRPVARFFFDRCAERLPGANVPHLDYTVAGRAYRVGHRSFFQSNRHLLDRLVELAVPERGGGYALDLYAGVGLFTLPLAARFERVVAVEAGTAAVRDLEFNASRAGLTVEARRASVDEYLARCADRPDFILADPPRAGLGKAVVGDLLRLRPERLTVVSCDPSTLARDLAALLAGGYALESLTMVDLFPQTFHIESVACLALRG